LEPIRLAFYPQSIHSIHTMKIEHKSVMTVKITYAEATEALKVYQKDMLSELWSSCEKQPSFPENNLVEFMYRLLEGPNSDWFQDMIEKHGIPWLDADGACGTVELIYVHPHVFFSADVLDQCDKDTQFYIGNIDQNGEFYGTMLDNKKILDNF
jgi:hypothetical protein